MSTPEKPVAKSLRDRFSNPLIISLLLAAMTLTVYWPAHNCGFIDYDDPIYFYKNKHVLSGLTPENIVWAFSSIDKDAPTWHPLTWISLMIDADLFDKNPSGPHLVNLLFHAANVVLLFLLLRLITRRFWPCAVTAALFGLHPLHVESVAWISERKDVLSLFFGLLALNFYARFVEDPKLQTSKSRIFYFLTLTMFACGLMSKPLLVTLPFVMLLLDFWPLKRFKDPTVRRLLLEKIPFFFLSAIDCIITVFAQEKGNAVATLSRFPPGMRIENTFVSYARYLEKTFWPFSFANPYPHPGWWPVWLVILSAALFLVCSIAAIYFVKKFPFAFVGWFWFAGTFVPMIGLVQVGGAAMADRYTYLPLIGIFIVLAWMGAAAFDRFKFFRPAIVIFTLLIFAGLSFRTRDQIRYWQNDGTLFSHAMAVTKNNYVAAVNLGTWYSKQGDTKKTLDCYDRALRMNPNDPSVLFDVGNAFAKLGLWDEAIHDYRGALQFAPADASADILNNLGLALAQEQQFAEAQTNFEAALKIDPKLPGAHNNLATILFRRGNYTEAAQHFYKALEETPDNPQILVNLGETLLHLGKIDAAKQCYEEAVQLAPDNVKFRKRLQFIQQHSN
ncbi:MAG TPA: tetratricopeptide repeat protein [Verrucomicrobiae bacterium]|nr:tetratricopeptide repeat protein [Verrucomicrobiae bacterium]